MYLVVAMVTWSDLGLTETDVVLQERAEITKPKPADEQGLKRKKGN